MKSKILLLLSLLLCSVFVFAAEWTTKTGFKDWVRPANCTTSVTPEGLVIKVIKNDPFIVSGKLDIATAPYNCIELTYKANGITPHEYAVLYYVNKKSFNEAQAIYITNLRGDNKWHTRRVHISNLANWKQVGKITQLRLDPLARNKGTITIKSLRFINAAPKTAAKSVQNAGFEKKNEDAVNGWLHSPSGGRTPDKGRISSLRPRSGKYCLETPGGCSMVSEDLVALKPDTNYRVSIYHRNTIPNGELFFGIRESLASDRLLSKTHLDEHKFVVTPNQTEWKQLSFTFKTAKKTVAGRLFISSNNGGDGSAWWDDLKVEAIKVVPPPFTLKPYAGLVTLTVSDNKLAVRQGKKRFLDPVSPENMPLEIVPDASVKNGNISITVKNSKKTFFNETISVGKVKSIKKILPVAKLSEGAYDLTVTYSAPKAKTYSVSKKLWRIPRIQNSFKFEPIKTVSSDKDGNFLVNGKKFRIVRFSQFPVFGGMFSDKNKGAIDLLKYGMRDFGINITSLNAWAIPIVINKKLRAQMPEDKFIDMVVDAARKHFDQCQKYGLYCSFDTKYIFSPDRKQRNYELVSKIIKRIKDHPALFQYGFDEPEVGNFSKEDMFKLHQTVKAADPNRNFSINLCQWWRFKDFGFSDVASYDNYPYPSSNLAEIANLNKKMLAAQPNKPFISIMQAFNYDGMEVPPQDFLTAELMINVIDNSSGVAAYIWDEWRRYMLNEPELQANMKLVCYIDRAIAQATEGKKVIPLKAKVSHLSSAYKRKGNIVMLVNYSNTEKCTFEFPLQAKSVSNMFDKDSAPEFKNNNCKITLPPYGFAVLEAK